MTRFTVLGESGFIGGCLASRLAKTEHQVLRPARNELRSLEGHDLGHVFYCLGIDDAPENPHGAFEAHIEHLINILHSATLSSLTYLSSTRLYLGAKSSRETADLVILHDDANAIYNVTKITGEQICFAAENSRVRVVRLSNVIGFAPYGTSLIPTLIKNAMSDGKMHLTISPQSSKDYIAIDDVIALLPRIALEGKQRCYNVASGINVRLSEIVGAIQHAFPSEEEWRTNAETIIFPTIDISRVQSEFSFAPRRPMDALAAACAEYRRHFTAIGAPA